MPVTAEALFERHFLPLYPPDARADLARARATDANPAKNPSVLAHLEDAARVFAARGAELFGDAIDLDFSDASVHRLSVALTTARRDAWAADGAGTPEGALFNVVVHGAAYVGACVVRNHGGAWLVRRPLWESMVRLESRAGEAVLAPFSWWLKSLADGADATLADRYRSLVEVPCARPEELAPIATIDRPLLRLVRARWSTLHKWLRANVPELRDVGRDFPNEERFDAYAFRWMDFLWLGERRMLLMAGLGEGGLHLFWLTAAGFEKAAHLACDLFPEPKVTLEDGKLVVVFSQGGKVLREEMLWWGP